MKIKLAQGLAHLMGPHHKGDEPMAGVALASPPPSPYPGRRGPLPTKVEADLRAACAAVLTNTKPSHHYVAPGPEDPSRAPKPQLDYAAIKRSASTRKSADSRAAVPHEVTHPVKYAYRPDTALEHLFPPGDSTHELLQANVLRRKDEAPPQTRSKTPVSVKVIPSDAEASQRPRPTQRSLSAETSHSTPQTDVTEYPWSTSTAPTSAGITPARASKRASLYVPAEQEPPSKTTATAIEWMRIELERRRKKQAPVDDAPPPTTESRPPSRARSIRNNIKEYIRPSTAGSVSRDSSRPVSRSASRASMRTTASEQAQDIAFRGGWRSWGRSRKDETRSDISRSNSARGRSENRKGSTSNKADLNLNRELPPLPSLDKWKDPAPDSLKQTPTNLSHTKGSKSVDSMMSEKDEIVAARLGSPVKERPEVYVPTRSPKSGSGANLSTFSLATAHTQDMLSSSAGSRAEHVFHRSKSTSRPQTRTPVRPAPTSPQVERPQTSIPRPTSVNYSRVRSPTQTSKPDSGFSNASTGFSKHRNYDSSSIPPALSSSKADRTPLKHNHEQKYRHVMDVLRSRSPPPVPPKDEKKWWILRSKSKKPSTWMDQLEKMGIKDGMLVGDEACGAPVIRY